MKTYKEFIEESYQRRQDLNEIGPLALLGLGSGLYYGSQAVNKFRKGDYKGGALDALAALPVGGIVFKGAKALGAGRNLARLASTGASTAKWSKLLGVNPAELKNLPAAAKPQPKPQQRSLQILNGKIAGYD